MAFSDPDWFTLTELSLEPEKPIRSEQGMAFYANPIAMAMGKPDAPKITGRALDIGAGNLSGTTAITGLDNCASLLLSATAVNTSTGSDVSASIGYQLSTNGGTSWGSAVVIAASDILGGGGGETITACASGATIVNMVGSNAIRLSGSGTLSGAAIWVKGE